MLRRVDAALITLWGAKTRYTPRDHRDLQAERSADAPRITAKNSEVGRRVTLTAPSDLRAMSEIRLPTPSTELMHPQAPSWKPRWRSAMPR
jgi:hypothetical protein